MTEQDPNLNLMLWEQAIADEDWTEARRVQLLAETAGQVVTQSTAESV